MRERVEKARGVQRERLARPIGDEGRKTKDGSDWRSGGAGVSAPLLCNADMGPAEVREFCKLDEAGS